MEPLQDAAESDGTAEQPGEQFAGGWHGGRIRVGRQGRFAAWCPDSAPFEWARVRIHRLTFLERIAFECRRLLADDLLEGRDTGAKGHEIAARYVATQFAGMGLTPANKGDWYQRVPMVEIKPNADAQFARIVK